MNNAVTRRDVLLAAGSVPLVALAEVFLGSGNAEAATGPTLQSGSRGVAVVQLQKRLTYLRFMPGAADGAFGPMTHQAVVTVQKLYGLGRDGVVGPITQRVLLSAHPIGMPSWARGYRAAVDIQRQIMFFYHGNQLHVIGISSGSGRTYFNPGSSVPHVAHTPRGSFHIQRRVRGLDRSPLGELWDPGYFTGGYAIHGSLSVPPFPASHGCIRVDMALRFYVVGALPVGAPLIIR